MITIRAFRYYADAPLRDRRIIDATLGNPKRVMRVLARFQNAPIVVAYFDGRPIGWSALIPKAQGRKPTYPWLMVFVQRKFRLLGVGRVLIDRLCKTCRLDRRYITYDAQRVKFFAKMGVR